MNVLVVDDNEKKRKNIIEFFIDEFKLGKNDDIDHVGDVSSAFRMINAKEYDAIILDLMLPYHEGGEPHNQAGIELLKMFGIDEKMKVESVVVGLSEYGKEIEQTRELFENFGFMIIEYEENSEKWKFAIRSIISRNIDGAGITRNIDFLIVVALEKERAAFCHADIVVLGEKNIGGLNLQYLKIEKHDQLLFGAILLLPEMGLVSATAYTSRAVAELKPTLVAMGGICAGHSDETEIGQIIIANPAWEYQAGKWAADEFKIAPSYIKLDPVIRVELEQLAGESGLMAVLECNLPQMRRPSVVNKPVISPFSSGSAVVAKEEKVAEIKEQHRKFAALDMETYGIYYVGHESGDRELKFFSAKCVVDFANESKGDDMHLYGSIVSARFVIIAIARIMFVDAKLKCQH